MRVSFFILALLVNFYCLHEDDCKKITQLILDEEIYIKISNKERNGRYYHWQGVDSLNNFKRIDSLDGFLAILTDSLDIGDKIVKRKGEMVYKIIKHDREILKYRPNCPYTTSNR